jgi:hypothetical protein
VAPVGELQYLFPLRVIALPAAIKAMDADMVEWLLDKDVDPLLPAPDELVPLMDVALTSSYASPEVVLALWRRVRLQPSRFSLISPLSRLRMASVLLAAPAAAEWMGQYLGPAFVGEIDQVFHLGGRTVRLLDVALEHRCLPAAEFLLSERGASCLVQLHRSALEAAVEAGFPEGVALLLRLREWDQAHLSQLLGVALSAKVEAVAEQLLDCVHDVWRLEEPFDGGHSILGASIENGFLRMVQTLVDKGVSVVQRSRGILPMEIAIRARSAAAMSCFVQRYPQLLKMHYGRLGLTALALSLVDCKEGAQVLLEHGADTEVACLDGSTALGLAVACGDLAAVDLLLHHKASVESCSRSLRPLAIAVTSESPPAALVERLCASGADVNIEFQFNCAWAPACPLRELTDELERWTPLAFCIATGKRECALALLGSGRVRWQQLLSLARALHVSAIELALEQEEHLVACALIALGALVPKRFHAFLTQQQHLDLSHHGLDDFPTGLSLLMPNLTSVSITRGNPLRKIPEAVKAKGEAAVWQYFVASNAWWKTQPWHKVWSNWFSLVHRKFVVEYLMTICMQAKIVVLGGAGSGKTHLVRRLKDPGLKVSCAFFLLFFWKCFGLFTCC